MVSSRMEERWLSVLSLVKPKTINLIFDVCLLGTQHLWIIVNAGWLGRIVNTGWLRLRMEVSKVGRDVYLPFIHERTPGYINILKVPWVSFGCVGWIKHTTSSEHYKSENTGKNPQKSRLPNLHRVNRID